MPTNQSLRHKRYLVTGHFNERLGYKVDRAAGCHDWLLIYTHHGAGRFRYAGGELCTRPHDVVLVAPHTPHHYEVSPLHGAWELLWAHFIPPIQWQPWLKWPTLSPGFGFLHINGSNPRMLVRERLGEANRLMSGCQLHREALALNALQAAILWCDEQNPLSQTTALDPRIRDTLDFICRNLDQPLTVDSVARHCHLSSSRLAHLFRDQVQMTPMQFIECQRIERACQLLEQTDFPIAFVAQRAGIGDPFYFSRRFKKAIGLSPREYRKHLGSRSVPLGQ